MTFQCLSFSLCLQWIAVTLAVLLMSSDHHDTIKGKAQEDFSQEHPSCGNWKMKRVPRAPLGPLRPLAGAVLRVLVAWVVRSFSPPALWTFVFVCYSLLVSVSSIRMHYLW